MQRQLLHGKIHRATVTDACIDYEGSITIDQDLLDAADIKSGEKVLIANLDNGARIESYAMSGERGKGDICLNGGAARYGKKGDLVIIMTFVLLREDEIDTHESRVVLVNRSNKIVTRK